jgi:hypothetical protein
MSLQGDCLLSGLRVPQLHGFIVAAAGDPDSVGTKRDAEHVTCVPLAVPGGAVDNGWATSHQPGDIVWRFDTPGSVDLLHLHFGDNDFGSLDLGAYNLFYTTDATPQLPGSGGNWTAVPEVLYVQGIGTPAVADHINPSGNQVLMNRTGSFVSADAPGDGRTKVDYALELLGWRLACKVDPLRRRIWTHLGCCELPSDRGVSLFSCEIEPSSIS